MDMLASVAQSIPKMRKCQCKQAQMSYRGSWSGKSLCAGVVGSNPIALTKLIHCDCWHSPPLQRSCDGRTAPAGLPEHRQPSAIG